MSWNLSEPFVDPGWASGGSVVEPPEANKDSGWTFQQVPNSTWTNWLQNTFGNWLLWINERIGDGANNNELIIRKPSDGTTAIAISDDLVEFSLSSDVTDGFRSIDDILVSPGGTQVRGGVRTGTGTTVSIDGAVIIQNDDYRLIDDGTEQKFIFDNTDNDFMSHSDTGNRSLSFKVSGTPFLLIDSMVSDDMSRLRPLTDGSVDLGTNSSPLYRAYTGTLEFVESAGPFAPADPTPETPYQMNRRVSIFCGGLLKYTSGAVTIVSDHSTNLSSVNASFLPGLDTLKIDISVNQISDNADGIVIASIQTDTAPLTYLYVTGEQTLTDEIKLSVANAKLFLNTTYYISFVCYSAYTGIL